MIKRLGIGAIIAIATICIVVALTFLDLRGGNTPMSMEGRIESVDTEGSIITMNSEGKTVEVSYTPSTRIFMRVVENNGATVKNVKTTFEIGTDSLKQGDLAKVIYTKSFLKQAHAKEIIREAHLSADEVRKAVTSRRNFSGKISAIDSAGAFIKIFPYTEGMLATSTFHVALEKGNMTPVYSVSDARRVGISHARVPMTFTEVTVGQDVHVFFEEEVIPDKSTKGIIVTDLVIIK